MSTDISQRKRDHIDLCATGDVGFRDATTLLGCVRLVHDSLPDLDADALDTRVTVLGKTLKFPLIIAAMTGGTAEAAARLVSRSAGDVAGFAFLIELDFLEGRSKLAPHKVASVIHY